MRADEPSTAGLIPTPAQRHPFERWLWERRTSARAAAGIIGVSYTYLGRFMLPPEDARYVRPSPEIIDHIARLTEGAVTAEHWPAPVPSCGAQQDRWAQ